MRKPGAISLAAGFEIVTFRDLPRRPDPRPPRRGANWRPRACRHSVRTSSDRDGLQVLINSMRAREDGRVCEVQIVARKPD